MKAGIDQTMPAARWRIARVKTYVAGYFGLRPEDLERATNRPAVCRPRQIAMYLCSKRLGMSLPEIARRFGGKHHTTALHAVRIVEKRRQQSPELDALLEGFQDAEAPANVDLLTASVESLRFEVRRLRGAA